MNEGTGFWGSIFDNLGESWESMKAHPDRTSIALDTLGSNIAPDNPFAGIGTAMGKSSLAAKAETEGQKDSQNMFQQLLKAMTPGDKPGPTSLTTSLGKDGTSIDYNVKGLGGLDQPIEMPGAEISKIPAEDDNAFAARFGGEGGY